MTDDRKRILLVETDPADARRVRAMLEPSFEVQQVDALPAALERLSSGDIEVVVLNPLLADSQGVETFARVCAQAMQIPIVVLSELDDEALTDKIIQEGAFAYISKERMNRFLLTCAVCYAIERRQAEQTLQMLSRELELLVRSGRAFSSTLDLDQVLRIVLEETRCLLDVAACSVWLLDRETDELVCQQATGPGNDVVRGWRLAPGEGIAGWAAGRGESLIVPDAEADARHFVDVSKKAELRLRSILTVPLKVKEQVIGVLQAVDLKINRFGEEELRLLESLGASAAVAIENARLYDKAQREIERRGRAEAALRESEKQFRTLAKLAPVGIYLTDARGHCQYANERWLEMANLTLEEALGGGWVKGLYSEDREQIAAAWYEMIESGEPWRREYRFRDGEGGMTWVYGLATPRFDDRGEIIGYIGVNLDITERKGAEEDLRDKEKRLQSLSGRLVEAQETERRHIARELHDEIGQALTVVKINLQAALSQIEGPTIAPYLEETIDTIDRLLQQVRDLSLNLQPPLLDDLGLVPALRWYVDQQSQQVGFSATFSAESLQEQFPHSVKIACFRIVQEALTNVTRHAQARHVGVELRQREDELHLTIQDDGKGFDVEEAVERAAWGEGLGLPGMEERVILIGGEIDITSSPMEGTQIRVSLPLRPD